MCLFLEAAQAWQRLIETRYYITAGRKGKLYQFRLDFKLEDFPHIAGMQYAQDVAFGLRTSEYYGKKLVPALLNGRLDGTKIEKSRNWERIRGRLCAIIGLQQTLESNFSIALFDPAKVPTNSKIDAVYVIKNQDSGESYFIFIDKDKQYRHYCKSAFAESNINYMKNQSMLTLLKLDKFDSGKHQLIYQHPNYIDEDIEVMI
ncbi:MAG: hypothetical protein IKW10_07720 [Oscillospiraceae bacterium]|nr:hypothetical protein [Oscillospiraceae bacterium]